MSTACPRLETGNNSVMPGRSPTIPASAKFKCDMPALRSPPLARLKENPNAPERAVVAADGHVPATPGRRRRVDGSPAISHGSCAPGPPGPASSSLHADRAVPIPRGDYPSPRTSLTDTLGVSLWGRRPILSPSQTSGSYLRPATRSFIGISALSVVFMCSSHTSVHPLLHLQ